MEKTDTMMRVVISYAMWEINGKPRSKTRYVGIMSGHTDRMVCSVNYWYICIECIRWRYSIGDPLFLTIVLDPKIVDHWYICIEYIQ